MDGNKDKAGLEIFGSHIPRQGLPSECINMLFKSSGKKQNPNMKSGNKHIVLEEDGRTADAHTGQLTVSSCCGHRPGQDEELSVATCWHVKGKASTQEHVW